MDKRKEICVYIETEEEHQRKKKHDERVRSFSFHCFSIINFGAREWIATGWERIAAVAAAAFVYDIWFRWEEDFEYYFHICVHIQPTPNTNIWNAELFFSLFLSSYAQAGKERKRKRTSHRKWTKTVTTTREWQVYKHVTGVLRWSHWHISLFILDSHWPNMLAKTLSRYILFFFSLCVEKLLNSTEEYLLCSLFSIFVVLHFIDPRRFDFFFLPKPTYGTL